MANNGNKILLAVDFSPASKEAAQKMLRFLKEGDKVFVLSVVHHIPYDTPDINKLREEQTANTNAKQAEYIKIFEDAGYHAEALVRDGDPRQTIINTAHELYAHLIVMGTRGLSGMKRTLLGSCADYIVRHAECPVMVVRESNSE
mmetsp:Transcript_31516/g.88418  ORF Transcript_31516/g.88418 Transcript_31516/m.88418 type:complete len:145 (-) Transcript_31516:80-514(-)|eukprot:CAMPEP_0119122096 /NCGR_PEP_ID=MMETSP1310-20130426/2459_1 /TAXON_ID=464262 /ORGANISM="Genus nov. species nov., Strain RCC2339" /LENGTH=144 /DNA_ID=CAMNT_0007111705 /DNA_START=68 /DNA_END=502 /DNA_ORIENTATION=-